MTGLIKLNSLQQDVQCFLNIVMGAQRSKDTGCVKVRTNMSSHVNTCLLYYNLCSEARVMCVFLSQVTMCPEPHSCTKQMSFLLPQAILISLSHSLTHLLLLQSAVSQPMPDHSLSNWQIWNNKTAAETTTTRCLCHPSLHANFDKPDTLGTANCLPQCSSRPSFHDGPYSVSFFKLWGEHSLTAMLIF